MRLRGLLQSAPGRITQYTRTEYELNIMEARYMASFRFVRNYSKQEIVCTVLILRRLIPTEFRLIWWDNEAGNWGITTRSCANSSCEGWRKYRNTVNRQSCSTWKLVSSLLHSSTGLGNRYCVLHSFASKSKSSYYFYKLSMSRTGNW